MAGRPRRRARSPLEIALHLALLEHQIVPRQAPAAQACATCGLLVRVRSRGRCPACYAYWHRTGRERPPERWARFMHQPDGHRGVT
jgi:hypothetical protein